MGKQEEGEYQGLEKNALSPKLQLEKVAANTWNSGSSGELTKNMLEMMRRWAEVPREEPEKAFGSAESSQQTRGRPRQPGIIP